MCLTRDRSADKAGRQSRADIADLAETKILIKISSLETFKIIAFAGCRKQCPKNSSIATVICNADISPKIKTIGTPASGRVVN
jgi:hypothetical protein